MPTVQSLMVARLAADAALTADQPGGLGFAIYDRWLVPTGPGSTPAAFDPARGGRLKRSIVVLGGGENPEPGRQSADEERFFTVPTAHIFAEAHANGKTSAQAAYLRIKALLKGYDFVLSPDERIGFVSSTSSTADDSEQFPGNIVIVSRWRLSGTRRLVPA